MIEIGFDPNLQLGPLTLSWHGIFTAVGIFFGVALPVRLLRGRIKEDDTYAVATWGVIGGIIGARLVHVADRWAFYAENPLQILAIWTGGIAVWGAVIGGVIAGVIVARQRRLPVGHMADASAPGIGIGLAIGRIGDVINGEHHATPCDVGVCVGYTHPETLGQVGPVHLAIGYELVWDLVTVGVALLMLAKRRSLRLTDGAIFWIWAFLYAIGRFTISYLRIGDPVSLFGLRQDQLFGLGLAAVAVPVLIYLLTRPPTATSIPPAG